MSILRSSIWRSMMRTAKSASLQVLLRIDLTDDAFAGRAGFLFLHHALADGRHLRTVIGIDDRRDDVAAESGTDLIEQILVDLARLILGMRADFKARAVGRQTAGSADETLRTEVTAYRRGPNSAI